MPASATRSGRSTSLLVTLRTRRPRAPVERSPLRRAARQERGRSSVVASTGSRRAPQQGASSCGGQSHDGVTPSRSSWMSPTGVATTGRLHISASLTEFGEPSTAEVERRQSAALIRSGTVAGIELGSDLQPDRPDARSRKGARTLRKRQALAPRCAAWSPRTAQPVRPVSTRAPPWPHPIGRGWNSSVSTPFGMIAFFRRAAAGKTPSISADFVIVRVRSSACRRRRRARTVLANGIEPSARRSPSRSSPQ